MIALMGNLMGIANPNLSVGQLLQIIMKHLEINLVHEAHDVATRTNDSESSPEIGGKHLLCSSVFDQQLVKGILTSSLRLTDNSYHLE